MNNSGLTIKMDKIIVKTIVEATIIWSIYVSWKFLIFKLLLEI